MNGEENALIFIEELSSLGLAHEEALLYVSILRKGGVEGIEADGQALTNLVGLALVRSEIDERGKPFLVATHPRIAVNSLINRVVWANQPADAGRGTAAEDEMIASHQADLAPLVVGLEGLLQRGETPPLVAYEDADAFAAALVDAIAEADVQVRGVTARGWLPNIALVWGAICDALGRGIPYYRLSDLVTWVSWGYAINRRDVRESGVRLRISTSAIADKYFIVDDHSAFIFESGPSEGRFTSSGTRMRNRLLVAGLVDSFDDAWEAGVPAEAALDATERLRGDFLARARGVAPDALDVAAKIFDYGVYCSYTPDERATARALLADGMVRGCGNAFGVDDCLIPAIEDDLRSALGI